MDISKYVYKEGDKPIVVLTGTLGEFEEFCTYTNRDTKTALRVSGPSQLQFYPECDIILYGSYWLNDAYNSAEYEEAMRERKLAELKEKGI